MRKFTFLLPLQFSKFDIELGKLVYLSQDITC